MALGRRLLVAGNWKMNGTRQMVRDFVPGLEAVPGVDLVIFPPYAYLADMAAALAGSPVQFGAQDVHTETSGAYTGDVSADMVADLDAGWVVVGHSERREYYGEDDATIARKLERALDAGLCPILCVGESLSQRETGDAESTVGTQISRVAEIVGSEALQRSAIAYEPVWAIGTGKTATPEQAADMHAAIRRELHSCGVNGNDVTVLYGGSVNDGNAAALFSKEDIDGALVGGASLASESFMAIARALSAARGLAG